MTRGAVVAAAWLVPALCAAMTFEEVSRIAYEHSVEKSEAEGKRQALIHEKEAYSAAEPIVIEGSTRRIRADERNAEGMEYGMMVGFTAKNPRVAEAQRAHFDASIKTVEGAAALHKGILQIILKREYLFGELARAEALLYEEKHDSAQKAYAMARKKHQAGRISQMELARFETEQHVAKQEAEEALIAYRQHQDALRELTLMQQEIRIDDLKFQFLDPLDAERELNESSVLSGFALAQEELARQIETLRRSGIETVGIGVGMTQEPTQNSVDLRISVPLSYGDKNQQMRAALMAKHSALSVQKELTARKLRLALEQAFQRLEGLRRLIEESASAEKRHEALYKMADRGFEGGVVGLFEYLETKNRFYGAQIETLRLKHDYVDEVAKTEEKLGGIWE